MNIRKLALVGVAAVAFAGLVSGEASARTRHPSTPAERQQTAQLNQNALQNAQASTNVSVAPASATPSTAGSYDNGTMGANGTAPSANGTMTPASAGTAPSAS